MAPSALLCGALSLAGCAGDSFQGGSPTAATAGAGGGTSTGTGGTGGTTGAGGGQGGTGGGAPVPLCKPGAQEACYSGPPSTEGVGVCIGGLRTCQAKGDAWGPCKGEVTPAPAEDCSTPADDDCDGLVVGAGGCVCLPGVDTQPCYTGPPSTLGVGPCVGGTQTCNADGKSFGTCVGEVLPAKEICATLVDEDCDGLIFDDAADGCICEPGAATQACYTGPAGTEGVGICLGGTATCNADGTSFGPCDGEVLPVQEICSTALDEDCNGLVFDDAAAGCVCEPTTTTACYEGPAGTLGVGVCIGGNKTCAADGKGYGACNGEQLPAMQDDCANQLDDDCNGVACAATVWAHLYGDSAIQTAPLVVWDAHGDLLAAGTFYGSIDFGDGPHIAVDNGDIYVVKLDSTGKVLWSKSFGDVGKQTLDALTVEPSGDLVLAFRTDTLVDLDGLAYGPGVVVARLAGATGTRMAAIPLGGAVDAASVNGLARSANGVYAVGTYAGKAFATATLGAAQGWDAFVLRLDPVSLALASGKSFGDADYQKAYAVAADPAGNVVVGGVFKGGIPPLSAAQSAGGYDAFVARFASDLSLAWVHTYGGSLSDEITSVATDANGDVFVGGDFEGQSNLGGIQTFKSNGLRDVFAAKLNSAGGHMWSRAFGSAAGDYLNDLQVGPSGEVVVTGSFAGDIVLGNFTMPVAGATDAFLVKLDAVGDVAWAKGFGDLAIQVGTSVAIGPTGQIALGAIVVGSVDFGLGSLTSAGATDSAIAVFNP